jgi:DNA-binding response OmpR family regulator
MWSNRKKILLVDDEHDITITLHTILEKGGFEVVSLNDPILALQSFKPRYYDLLVLDVRMLPMNGFELYQQLRKKDSRVKVCFLTAVTDFTEYEQYKKDVFPKSNERYFVAKPIPQDELIRKINEMLANNTTTHYIDT